MTGPIDYGALPTEQINRASTRIDRLPVGKILKLINQQDQQVPKAVRAALPSIEKAVKIMVQQIQKGGRLLFLGAGTSGRLGILEAAECPPTFDTPPSLVQALMAGGKSSVFRSKEGAEDRGSDAARWVNKHVKAGDVVIGVAASGVTPFVRDGLAQGRRRKARTILVTCNTKKLKSPAELTIAVKSGPEVITGSTRLKAGTATKLVLNSLTVATMVQLGKVYGNLMVDLQPRSRKLHERALRLIQLLGRVSRPEAQRLLKASGKSTKTAIVMSRKKFSKTQAQQALRRVNGHLHRVLS